MGGNESREVGDGGDEDGDGELGIYRDLLEVDGCESGWRDRDDVEVIMGDEIDGGKDVTGETGAVVGLDMEGAHERDADEGGEEATVNVHEGEAKYFKGYDEQATTPSSTAECGKNASPDMRRIAPKSIGRVSVLTTEDGELLRTSDGRLLAEPPLFDYDELVRFSVPSPGKLKLMFGRDVSTSTAFRDLETERALFTTYGVKMYDERKKEKGHAGFYDPLVEAILEDAVEVFREYETVTSSFTPLLKWEGRFLDNDDENGNTVCLQNDLESGEDPFYHPLVAKMSSDTTDLSYYGTVIDLPAAREKYDYLLDKLPRRPAHDMSTWVYHRRQEYTGLAKAALTWSRDGTPSCPWKWEDILLERCKLKQIFSPREFGGVQAWEEFRTFARDAKDASGAPLVPKNPWDDFHDPKAVQEQLKKFWEEKVIVPDKPDGIVATIPVKSSHSTSDMECTIAPIHATEELERNRTPPSGLET